MKNRVIWTVFVVFLVSLLGVAIFTDVLAIIVAIIFMAIAFQASACDLANNNEKCKIITSFLAIVIISFLWINVYMAFDPVFQEIQNEFFERGMTISWDNNPDLQPLVKRRDNYARNRGIILTNVNWRASNDWGAFVNTGEIAILPPWQYGKFFKFIRENK